MDNLHVHVCVDNLIYILTVLKIAIFAICCWQTKTRHITSWTSHEHHILPICCWL